MTPCSPLEDPSSQNIPNQEQIGCSVFQFVLSFHESPFVESYKASSICLSVWDTTTTGRKDIIASNNFFMKATQLLDDLFRCTYEASMPLEGVRSLVTGRWESQTKGTILCFYYTFSLSLLLLSKSWILSERTDSGNMRSVCLHGRDTYQPVHYEAH